MTEFLFKSEMKEVDVGKELDKIDSKPGLLEWFERRQIYVHESIVSKPYVNGAKEGKIRWLYNKEVKILGIQLILSVPPLVGLEGRFSGLTLVLHCGVRRISWTFPAHGSHPLAYHT